jgi:hypothetical protein
MSTRYQRLRDAVAILAAPAVEQSAYLDKLFQPLTGSGSAAAYGSDELALGLDDIFCAANDMIEFGELSEVEAGAIAPLDNTLTRLSGEHNAAFWRREALLEDQRWAEVREIAQEALLQLPDELRPFGRFNPSAA